jgi:hypothetical protein
LYLPQQWFEADSQERRERTGIPEDRQFQTKIELGLEMIWF